MDTVDAPKFESPTDPVRAYLRDLKDLHLKPAEFFRRTPPTGGMGGPLAFALVTHWMGSALSFLWSAIIGTSAREQLERYIQMMQNYSDMDARHTEFLVNGARSSIAEWMMGAGSVIADPFITLAGVLITAAFVYLGARMLTRSPVATFESAVRLVSYGMAPSILYGLPFVGGFVASLYIIVVTTIGAREYYRATQGRALAIAIFPKLLLYGALFLFLLFVIVVLVGLFSAALFH